MQRARRNEENADQIRLEVSHGAHFDDDVRAARVPAAMMDDARAGAFLRYERRGPVAWIRIERAAARNAMSVAMWRRLRTLIGEVAADTSYRALVLCGVPDAFVAGGDIADFLHFEGTAEALAYEADVEAALDALERLPIATIAAVSGACTGGGAILASTCDLRIGTGDARVGVPIARNVGNIATAANVVRLTAVAGRARVVDWLVTARLSDAAAALACGFFGEVVESYDALVAHAQAVGERIAGNAPLTIAAAKELARRLKANASHGVEDGDLLERCYGSADFREGARAFVAKRMPHFEGR
jgi:enoyl-CoA hydratase